MKKYIDAIKRYSKDSYQKLTREPNEVLPHPFIVPGACYAQELWDWDSWLTDIAMSQIICDNGGDTQSFLSYQEGCVLNFLSHQNDDGSIPIMIQKDVQFPTSDMHDTSMHKPCLCQHAAFISKQKGSASWLGDKIGQLCAFVDWYMHNCRHESTGLYYWIDDLAIGVDNDPCTFYRPKRSTASIYLNALMYKELLALAYLCNELGKASSKYSSEAEHLKDAINVYLWDERNGFYYSADLNLLPITDYWLHSGAPRHWSSIIMKIDVWHGVLAMWAGIATPERAKRMVVENIQNERIFCGRYGIRSLATTEQMYCIVKTGNPSCWLGPVWGITNYITYKALRRFGFDAEANALANKTITLFGKDLLDCGELHEYYDPDTGEGVNNQGFQSWNLLVNNIIADIENREVIEEF